MPGRRGTLEERFWTKVRKTDGCWFWTDSLRERGYGSIRPGGRGHRPLLAHRVSYEIHFGPIPDGLCVLHNCPGGDNPTCVRPDHLWLGTVSDNNADKFAKGRATHGEQQFNAKLTEATVLDARHRWATGGIEQRQLAEEFGVSRMAMSDVLRGATWKHVGGPLSQSRIKTKRG